MYKAIANLLHEGTQYNHNQLYTEAEIKDIPLGISKQIFEAATDEEVADYKAKKAEAKKTASKPEKEDK